MTPDSPAAAPAAAGSELFLGEEWSDALEAAVRVRIRAFIEGLLEAELDAVLARKRYERRRPAGDEADAAAPGALSGHRHGHRQRRLIGTFGDVAVRAPGWPSPRAARPSGGTRPSRPTGGGPGGRTR